jgi:hypothetical protein
LGRCSDAAAAAIIAQPYMRDALHDRIRRHNATAPYRQRRYWLIPVQWTAPLGLDYACAAADGGDP